MRRRKIAAPPALEFRPIPAAIGGLNSINAGMGMPPTDCFLLYNMLAAEYGLRTRLGSREWCRGLTGAGDNYIRSILPFTGSADNGAANKVFATTSTGIWDVTTSGVVTAARANTTAYALGDGATSGGTSWITSIAGTSGSTVLPSTWVTLTGYSIGDRVINNGNVYIATANGTSGATGPVGEGAGEVDGSVTWDFVSVATAVVDGSVTWRHMPNNVSPPLMLSFAITSGRAGHGVCTVHVTQAGHFLVYCDEENGLCVYTETAGTWAAVPQGATIAWAANTAYVVGDGVLNSGNEYECITSGTSAGSGGPTTTAADITDNTAHWKYIGAAPTGVISSAVQGGVDPANFAFVTVFKGRLWFVEKNTANLWYLGTGAIYGTVVKFTLGTKLKQGGPLVGLWSWTYDGGAGVDDSLVSVSIGGDVVIYQGTDPASASTFGIKGVWNVGSMPKGRELATDYGGELLLLTRTGILPMSKLVTGKSVDSTEYATAKISPLFNAAMLSKATTAGWTMRLHPEENALMVTVPEADGVATSQLMMALPTRSWSRNRDLPLYSSSVFGGQMYFGTVSGTVCINDGYVDGRPLYEPTAYTPVQYSGIGAFVNLDNSRRKMVRLIRPRFMGQSTAPSFSVGAKYDFDIGELDPVSLTPGAGSLWDAGVWDTAVWGGDYSPSTALRGGTGIGVNVAMAWRGAAVDRTILVGFDVGFVQGGNL